MCNCANVESPISYNDYRKTFKTVLTKNEYKPDGEADTPPGNLIKKITYSSSVGDLVAYISNPPKDHKKYPILIWARGGHGGIGRWLWEKDYIFDIAMKKGILVMAPSWRQDNNNPGRFSLFLGEIDDAISAIEYVKSLEYVDQNRIYMAGHSTGGTMSLLTPLASSDIRASFSIGGVADMSINTANGRYGREPYDYRKDDENYIRSATNFVHDIKNPIFYFEGSEIESYIKMSQTMQKKAREIKAPFYAYSIEGSDHSRHVTPLIELITDKIVQDTYDKINISFTQTEVQKVYNIFTENTSQLID
jgi:acetyl esterase/lipase